MFRHARGTHNNDTLIFAQPWSGYVQRPDVAELMGSIAQQTDLSVVSMDNYGMGIGSARPDKHVAAEIRHGNFDTVTTGQWEAVNDLPLGDTILLGYSLGASIAASQLKTSPENVTVDQVVFFEGVVEAVPFPLLAARFGLEAAKWRNYFPQNADWMEPRGTHRVIPKEVRPHVAPYLNYPLGISKGRLFEDLRAAREQEKLKA